MMRLRQIALVASELRPVEHDICTHLGLEVCYRDPGLAHFGLRHGLYAIGDQLLEVVAPKQPGTTAGRFLERRGGDGGYMVLLQTDDVAAHKQRLENDDIRIVHDGEVNERNANIRGIHLHPKDVGGAILSLDQATPAESWLWAGQDWAYHSMDSVVRQIVAVSIQAQDPERLAANWSKAVGVPVRSGVMELDDAQIRFVPAADGRGDGLASADLLATDRARVGEVIETCGFRFCLV